MFFLNLSGHRNCDAGIAIAVPANTSGHCNCGAGVAIAAPTPLFKAVSYLQMCIKQDIKTKKT